jgi:GNAT superfamily N-acetyltransferase
MSANLVVRQIGSKDEDDWRLLWTGYLEFYDASLPAEVYDTTFARILAGNDGAEWEPRGLLAEVAGRPVGLVHFMFQRHCWRVEKVCYLQDLYAVPEMRGNGIGRALIEAVYDRIGTRTPFIKYTR